MKKVFIFIVIIASLFLLSCQDRESSAEQKQSEETNRILENINNEIGLPELINFQQKKLMKMIMEECDKEKLICYAYIKADYSGKLVFIGKCLGYGVPFSAQYTNPEKIVFKSSTYGVGILPQADPNGLYMPTTSSATWLLLLDDKDVPRVAYFEPEIVVTPFKLNLE